MNATLVVIDDETIILEAIQSYFGRRNYTVFTAQRGEIGLDLIKEHNPDLLISDLYIKEGIQGKEILQRALALKPDLKVLIVTGFGADADVVKACLAKGAKAVIPKPMALSTLLQEVEKLLA